MVHSRTASVAGLSANDAFKLRYPRYLKLSVLVALALTALFTWLWPGYQAQPYTLRQDVIEILELDTEAPLIEPPRPRKAPRLPPIIESAPEDDPGAVETIPDLIPIETPIEQIPDWQGQDAEFVPSSSNPVLTHAARAEYPYMARRAGIEGTVIVQVLVGVDGRVERAEVLQGAHPLLERAALDAARRCLFVPGKQREWPVAVWVAIPFRFVMH